MAGIKISALPPVVAPALTDVFPIDQGLVTYKESAQQLLNLFESNIVITPANFSGVLPVSKGGSDNTTFTPYGVLTAGTTATGAFQNVVGLGAIGEQLTSNGPGALPTWQTVNTSPLTTKGDIFTFTTVNARLPVGTIDGQILQVASGAATGLAWSTPTYPSVSGTAGKLLRSDGTNNAYTTLTFPDNIAQNVILYANVANNLGPITPAASSVMISDAGSVPSWSTTLPAGTTVPGYLTTALASSHVFVGSAGNVATDVAMSGDIAITNLGATTIQTGVVSNAKLATAANLTVKSNISGGVASPSDNTLTAVIDATIGTVQGDLLYRNATVWTVLAPGSSGQVLQTGGAAANPSWTTSTFPTTGGAAGNVLISDGTNYISSTSLWPNTVGTSGKVVISNGTMNVYSTPTYPNASVTSGKFIISDGTNYIASTSIMPNTVGAVGKIIRSDGTVNAYTTATYPDTAGTSGNVLTSDGTNIISSAPAASTTSVIANDTTTNATMFPTWVTANTGSLPLKVTSTKLFYNPSTSLLTNIGALGQITNIQSSAGLPALSFGYTASAVNNIKIFSATTTNGPVISVEGTDAAIGLVLQTKNSNISLIDGTGTSSPALAFTNAANTKFTALKVATAQATNVTFTLPAADAAGFMISDGSAVLSLSGMPSDIAGSVTINGFSSFTSAQVRSLVVGKMVFLSLDISGTSNATNFSITGLPHAPLRNVNNCVLVINGGTNVFGLLQINTSATTLNVFSSAIGGAFLNTGVKSVFAQFWYEST